MISLQNFDFIDARRLRAFLKADLLLSKGAIDVARAVTVLDPVEQILLELILHLFNVFSFRLFATDMELRLFAAVLITHIGQNVHDSRASVELDLDFLLIFALAEENLTSVL